MPLASSSEGTAGDTGQADRTYGKTGVADIHLHIQARDAKGKPIHPDNAFLIGSRKPQTPINWPEVKWADFEVETSSVSEPKVVDGVVRINSSNAAPKGKTTFYYDDNAKKSSESGPLGYNPNAKRLLGGGKVRDQAPSKPLVGTTWLDAQKVKTMKFYDGGKFDSTTHPTLSGTGPEWELVHGPTTGRNRLAEFRGTLQGDSLSYRYQVSHPAKGRSPWSEPRTFQRQR